MTQPHVHANLIKRWADGTTIEACIGGGWTIQDNPEWLPSVQYRVFEKYNIGSMYACIGMSGRMYACKYLGSGMFEFYINSTRHEFDFREIVSEIPSKYWAQ